MEKYIILVNGVTLLIKAKNKQQALSIFEIEYSNLFDNYDFQILKVSQEI